MKTYVTRDIFIHTFQNSHDYNKFSMNALNALYEYYEMREDDCGEEMIFDYIVIACDWSEYDSATAYMTDNYDAFSDLDIEWLDVAMGFAIGAGANQAEEDSLIESKALEYLQKRTQVIEFAKGKVLVMQF